MTDLLALLEAHQQTRLLRLSFPRNDGPPARLAVNRFAGTEYYALANDQYGSGGGTQYYITAKDRNRMEKGPLMELTSP